MTLRWYILGVLAWLVLFSLAYLLGPTGFGLLLIVLGGSALVAREAIRDRRVDHVSEAWLERNHRERERGER